MAVITALSKAIGRVETESTQHSSNNTSRANEDRCLGWRGGGGCGDGFAAFVGAGSTTRVSLVSFLPPYLPSPLLIVFPSRIFRDVSVTRSFWRLTRSDGSDGDGLDVP